MILLLKEGYGNIAATINRWDYDKGDYVPKLPILLPIQIM